MRQSASFGFPSGLAFIPLAVVPVYCATKAAIHSFSWLLRHQLKNTTVKVIEIVPPIVDTELDKGAREKRQQEDRGIKPEVVASATIQALGKDEFEAGIGPAQFLLKGSENEPDQVFQIINAH